MVSNSQIDKIIKKYKKKTLNKLCSQIESNSNREYIINDFSQKSFFSQSITL